MRHRLRLASAYIRPRTARRRLMTLAIETSCDDTSVAIVEKDARDADTVAQLHFHKKITADNSAHRGVHPLVSLRSHQQNLARLVAEAIAHLPRASSDPPRNGSQTANIDTLRLPDFISVTRGPGMRSNLFTGLDTAKGLAVAWQKKLVGVHHMQAHALTPRMVSALEAPDASTIEPYFPFLSVLASGGHTLLIHSTSLAEHHVLGTTTDIAVGEFLDKVARIVLPAELLKQSKSTMYGALLETFVFPEAPAEMIAGGGTKPSSGANAFTAIKHLETFGHRYDWYQVPSNHEEAGRVNTTSWGWAFNQPLTKANGGIKVNSIELSFTGLLAAVERVVRHQTDPISKKASKTERASEDITVEERVDIAREAMRAAFEHVAYRVVLAMKSTDDASGPMPAVVMAGGVAANSFLRHILAATLSARGYRDTKLYFPPPLYCTDNAAMIAWAGLEMYEAGHADSLSIRAIRKWPLGELLNPQEDG